MKRILTIDLKINETYSIRAIRGKHFNSFPDYNNVIYYSNIKFKESRNKINKLFEHNPYFIFLSKKDEKEIKLELADLLFEKYIVRYGL